MNHLISRCITISLLTLLMIIASADAQRGELIQFADITPAPPIIPDKTFTLTDFGAIGDAKTMNTDAFKKALAAIAAAGGGKLIVPSGTFLTAPFLLTSKMDLHLNDGAAIQFPDTYEAYGIPAPADASPDQKSAFAKSTPALIGGDNLSDVAITGSGTIDGNGALWWGQQAGGFRNSYGNSRPKLIILSNSKRLHFSGVTLTNSPMWNLAPSNCSDILIENLHVTAPHPSPNTDAIDPNGCNNVLIRNCVLDEGDDNVAIKAIPAPCFNIEVQDCTCLHGHGISIGSETYKGIHDVTVKNCTFDGTDNGIRIKSARDRGNDLYNFNFTDVTMKNMTNAISINMYYMDRAGQANRTEQPVTATTPHLHDVTLKNVTATNAKNPLDITGLPESPVKNVTLINVNLTGQNGATIQDAQGVFQNVTITPASGDPVKSNHADILWKNPTTQP